MNKFLTNSERKDLLIQHKKERDKRIADRIKVVLLYDDGWTSEMIARALFIDDSTIRRHLHDYRDENRLAPDHKGSEPILTSEESESLSKHLEDKCYAKVKEIQEYVRKTYNKISSVSTLTTWLKVHDFTYKKPKITPKADPELQKEFLKRYEDILNLAALDGHPVLFGDSVHPSQQTRPSYGWIKKGKDKIIEVNNGQKRLNIMGAINLETLVFNYKIFDTINGLATIEYFKLIETVYPDCLKIYLILDNAGYHKSEEVQEYLKTSRIQVIFLPPRSPNLNAIEPLWKVMHEYVSNNIVYEKFKDFKKSTLNFFDVTMPSIHYILVSRITDNFRLTSCAK